MNIKTLVHRQHIHVFLMFAVAIAMTVIVSQAPGLTGYVVKREEPEPTWRIFTADEVASGATIPADTNVIFHIPEDIWSIRRRILLGRQGTSIRYWGYCFPEDYDPATAEPTAGFPGKLFLSEAERSWRDERIESKTPIFSIYRPPTKADVARREEESTARIRHQIETFKAGSSCYIMTEKPLPIGIDRDADGLNSREERTAGTDPSLLDTDGDGLTDGIEILQIKSKPLTRDTDGDGLIDGVEDRNRNGKITAGETSPINNDSDGDGLCDGYCRVDKGGRICSEFTTTQSCTEIPRARWMGEDKNLNGIVDSGETNPLQWSTAGDGISDLQQYYNCLLNQGRNC